MTKKRKYLITGATGFVGSCLLRKLIEDEQEVDIIIRRQSNIWRIKDLLHKVKIHYLDLSSDKELLNIFKTSKPDVIYHLATQGAYSYQNDPDQIIKTNILGTWNMIKASLPLDYELFVNTGSSSEYGSKTSVMKETDLLEPDSYYAVTKSTQTLLASFVAKSQKKPIVTLRPFSVYGPYEEPTRLIPTLMNALLFKKEMNMVNPDVARDMIYVMDVVSFYLMVDQLKQHGGEYFNVCTGVQSTIKDIVEAAVKVTGENTKFNWGGMEDRIWDKVVWMGDNTKAKDKLRWRPKYNLEEGLRKMWVWFQDNYKLYNTAKFSEAKK